MRCWVLQKHYACVSVANLSPVEIVLITLINTCLFSKAFLHALPFRLLSNFFTPAGLSMHLKPDFKLKLSDFLE